MHKRSPGYMYLCLCKVIFIYTFSPYHLYQYKNRERVVWIFIHLQKKIGEPITSQYTAVYNMCEFWKMFMGYRIPRNCHLCFSSKTTQNKFSICIHTKCNMVYCVERHFQGMLIFITFVVSPVVRKLFTHKPYWTSSCMYSCMKRACANHLIIPPVF